MSRPRVISTTPILVVTDLQRSVDFYCQKLGFGQPSIHGEPPCFAMIHRDRFELMLSVACKPEQVRPNGPEKIWDMYVRVSDVAAEQAALEAAGVTLDSGPTKTFYDMIEIEVVDADGYRVCFGQDTGGS